MFHTVDVVKCKHSEMAPVYHSMTSALQHLSGHFQLMYGARAEPATAFSWVKYWPHSTGTTLHLADSPKLGPLEFGVGQHGCHLDPASACLLERKLQFTKCSIKVACKLMLAVLLLLTECSN